MAKGLKKKVDSLIGIVKGASIDFPEEGDEHAAHNKAHSDLYTPIITSHESIKKRLDDIQVMYTTVEEDSEE